MTKRQFRVLVVLTIVFGFPGGAVSNLLFRDAPALAAGTPVQQEVRAKKFVLVDEAGKERAALDLSWRNPVLWLYDEAGEMRTALNSMGLSFHSEAGKIRTILNSTMGLSLHDEAGKMQVALAVNAGEPSLGLYDEAGKPRAGLVLDFDGSPKLALADASGQDRVVLGSEETVASGVKHKYPISTITLFGETGQVLWRAP